MRTATLAVLFTTVLLVTGCGKKDDQKVQGNWTVSKFELPEGDGKEAEFFNAFFKDAEVTISGDQATITLNMKGENMPGVKMENKPARLRYTFDSSKSPKQVDLTGIPDADEKDAKPHTVYAIYKLEGDTIVLAVGFAKGDKTAPRPTEFKPSIEKKGTPDESGVIVAHLTKKK